MMTELQPYLDGLFKIKMFVSQKREGLNAADTMVLCQTIITWIKAGLPINKRGPRRKWGRHFAAAVIVSYQFANGEVFRYGEGTPPQS